jgi:hypothetical protein
LKIKDTTELLKNSNYKRQIPNKSQTTNHRQPLLIWNFGFEIWHFLLFWNLFFLEFGIFTFLDFGNWDLGFALFLKYICIS